MGRLYANNYSTTTTTASLGTGDLSLDVTSVTGLPALSAGDYFIMTLTDSLTAPTVTEVIKVTAVSTLTLTIERALEGTTALTWVTGSFIELRSTAASFSDPDNPKFVTYTETVAAGTTALDPSIGTFQTYTAIANTTFTDSISDGQSMTLHLTAGASFTITWPTITWVGSGGNVAPTLTAFDVITFWKVGATLYGAYVGNTA
jgi:hypothetical protein